ncbi:MAG: hypothetical protein B6I19_03140 [Bacteroidetes bacterium 4572_114]|nr:MAG: hypothetical protein B6I19_03140 [Bacteroidetes bacterium 4572_114]
MKIIIFIIAGFISIVSCARSGQEVMVGADQTELYFPLLKGKRIAVVANHTSLIQGAHLVDSLVSAGVDVVKIFSPEHGFRGKAGAGQLIDDKIDLVTGLPVISLYGKHKKPTTEDLQDIDLVIFDIQDVGARFYTYISTMTYVMEACAENDIPVMVLDRPNPNGFYVDGPILDTGFSSFVGMHPVPIVHGMTVGEYAKMVNGERWLKDSIQCELKVIPVKNYAHSDFYDLPVQPSPNLPNRYAVYLYPSICLFEGTVVSVGRGTDYPFQVIGHPDFLLGSYIFVPRSIPGVATNPKHEGVYCNGQNLIGYAREMKDNPAQLNLHWLINYYGALKDTTDTTDFFTKYFSLLAGTDQLQKQIEDGWTEEQIRESWQPGLDEFKQIREKYLLYPDFD